MNKISLKRLIGSIFVVLSLIPLLLSQVSPNQSPLSIEKIEILLKPAGFGSKLQDQATSADIGKRGIDFVVTDEILARLKAAGAGPKTLQTLTKIRDAKLTPRVRRSNRLKIVVAKFADKSETNDNVTDVVINQLREATGRYPNVEIVALNESISAAEGAPIAIQKAKSQQADIIIWGWYKLSKSSVAINSQIQIVNSFDVSGSPVLKPREKMEVQDIPNFENFTSQLRISKEISFVTVVCLGLINFELGNFDESFTFFSDAVSVAASFPKLVDLPELYKLRGASRVAASCNLISVNNSATLSDIDKAISLGASPTDSGVLILQGYANLVGNPKAAMDLAEKSLKSADNDYVKTEGLFLMVLASAVADDEKKAKEYAKKLSEHLLPLPDLFENDFKLALVSIVLEDPVKTSQYVDKALKAAGPDISKMSHAYAMEGVMYSVNNNYDRMIISLRKSLDMAPGCAGTYSLLGDAYEGKEDHDSAITAYNQALEIDPNTSEVYVKLGAVYEAKKDFELAGACYAKAIDRDATSVEAYMALASLYVKIQNTDGAISAYSKILLIEKENEGILGARAMLYINSGKYDLALTDYQRWFPLAAKMGAKSTETFKQLHIQAQFLGLQIEFLKRGDFKHGIEFAELYISLYPSDSTGFYWAADYLGYAGKTDLAVQQISKGIALNPSDASYYVSRAGFWKTKENYKNALDDMAQAIRLKPDDANNYSQRSQIYEKMGKIELAISDLENAIHISKDPHRVELYKSYINI